jgi:two-component system phosphate regulon sensor histidine kinase PhoR
LLKSKELAQSETLVKYTEIIGSESNRLKNQVDKIMQMALIDSGNLTLEKKQLDLHDLIEKVAENLKMMVDEKSGSVSLNLVATKYLVLADETHLKNIVYNLMDNALKYSRDIPEIEIKTEDHKDGVVFSVKDNGIGMEKEQQKFIFDQFYRAQKGDVHDVKGFGLGLSYVKSIVEAHKGNVGLKSVLNEGSEFTVYLPLLG